jgi:hypothetical protein
MSIDGVTLLSKIVDRMAMKCGEVRPEAAALLTEEQKTEMVVEALASQLVQLFGLNSAPPNGGGQQPHASDLERICADQISRNRRLAQALGACECWGELPACELCGGRGAPGGRPPQRAAFNAFVRPVIRRMRHYRLAAHRPRGTAAATCS